MRISPEKVDAIRDAIISKAEILINNPGIGQVEEYLEHLGLNHRRLIEGHYKIIYRIENGVIIITDIFDSRMDPEKMKG